MSSGLDPQIPGLAKRFTEGLVRRGSWALVSQVLNSAGNFAVAVFVARTMGPVALGEFAVLFATLTVFTSLQTAWVGDSLTVLDRTIDGIRRGLITSQLAFTVGAFLIGGLIAILVSADGAWTVVAFSVLSGLWLTEEYGRRTFMARLEFRRLAGNEAIYLACLALGLTAIHAVNSVSLAWVLVVMSGGAAAASASATLILPPSERLRFHNLRGADLRAISRFGFWRAAQAGTGNLSTAGIRYAVLFIASASVVGEIEAARLVVAPLFVVVSASGNFLLSSFAQVARQSSDTLRSHMFGAMAALGSVGVVYGAAVLVFGRRLTPAISGDEFLGDQLLIFGWVLAALLVAVKQSPTCVALLRARPSTVFWLNFVGTLVAFGLATLAVIADQPRLVPLALSAGAGISGFLILLLVLRKRTMGGVTTSDSSADGRWSVGAITEVSK